ncbi:carboxypeptidase regulatory-like domain-containing protein [Acidicapsa dinghuensis]|uniref:Carboxypeptidase regulatory-like domain-containing protein n=1 Tax=Acidicapsa dinghuensis TaxID=2218256 RepID=A0ABW1EEU0_9BACT|nr:carboxypeptidase regulatory-like domain-containing protein [Acidicapsa dinghuensis]
MRRWQAVGNGIVCLMLGCWALIATAAEHYSGKVTSGGIAVPGATVTLTHDGKKLTAATDIGGIYYFDDVADGEWTIDVEMQGFEPLHATLTINAQTVAGNWQLAIESVEQLTAGSVPAPAAGAGEAPSVATVKKPESIKKDEGAAKEVTKAPGESEQAQDGFLVNGSQNNSATSQFTIERAFGNARRNGRSLYNFGFVTFVDNSGMDARPYAVSGVTAPKSDYTHVTSAVQFGGPLNVPHVMPHGPNLFAAYVWTRVSNAAINTGLVPTAAERNGDLSSLPVTITNPSTGQAYGNNQVPVSPQAATLLALFPMPNITGTPAYNYQAAVLNSVHQDTAQLRLDKTIGHRDQLFGGFNLESTRAGSENLFGFVDKTDALGLNSNVHWQHRFNPHLFANTGFEFSRQRIQIVPEFENHTNVSGAAGITGNDQDPTNWGPPGLNFVSGLAALSDANSAFNRDRTDSVSLTASYYRGRHNITAGGDFRRQENNELAQQNPRGAFTFTGAATGSDLADFLVGVPDASAIAFGNADKYFRESVYDAYATDDLRVNSALTINAGVRWEYGAPMTELFGRLVNLDIASGFTAAEPVLGSDPVGPVTGTHYSSSLMQPDRSVVEPRIGFSWRPFAASSVIVRGGYGIYSDTSVYLRIVNQMAQQAPLSKSLSVENSASCPLTLANGFQNCSSFTSSTFAVDPRFRVGYAQVWNLIVQRDLPFALQAVATYRGTKGTHGPQEMLPNSYPIGAANPCPDCPAGFLYETSGGNSTRQEGQLQVRRRLLNGFEASATYTYSKSIDDEAYLGGAGHSTASGPGTVPSASIPSSAAIAQNWLDARGERSLSSFDQRHLLNLQAQYTTGQGLHGGTLMSGWKGRAFKEWTVTTTIAWGTGMPETPVYPAVTPGTGFSGEIRPDRTSEPLYSGAAGLHLNPAAYEAPPAGAWGDAGRDSITGPDLFTLDSSLQRTFRPHGKWFLDVRVDSTNTLNHPAFSGWNSVFGNTQFGLPVSANAMRNLQAVLRVRF